MQILNVSIKLTAVYLFWVTRSCFLKARSGSAPQMQMQSMFLKCSQSEHAKGQLEDEASRKCLVTLSSRRWSDGVTDYLVHTDWQDSLCSRQWGPGLWWLGGQRSTPVKVIGLYRHFDRREQWPVLYHHLITTIRRKCPEEDGPESNLTYLLTINFVQEKCVNYLLKTNLQKH